jgi:hypothetical protein
MGGREEIRIHRPYETAFKAIKTKEWENETKNE